MQKMDFHIGQRIYITKNHEVSIINIGIRKKDRSIYLILGKPGTTGTYKTWLGLSDAILKL
jgi:hypothetical protein